MFKADFLLLSSVSLHLPKFSISADASLGETLAELGIIDAFGDRANFAGISGEVNLKLSKVGSATSDFCLFVYN